MAQDYRPQVERAVAFVLEHLEEPLTLAQVARAAHLSAFHFHRIFSAVMGEPVGRFVTRKRLEVAALRLAYEPGRSVTDIALAAGYSSLSNFSKAFAAYFGCAPSVVRDPAGAALPAAVGTLTRTYGKAFRPADLYALPPADDDDDARRARRAAIAARVRFETLAGFDVCCLAGPGGYDLAGLERTWEELIRRGRELGICGDAVDAYGMAFDSPQLTAPELRRYHACVPCPAGFVPPAPLFRSRVPAGRYAVFTFSGRVEQVEDHYREVYSLWFPQSSLAPDDFTPIERYVNDAPVDGAITYETWFKVRPRT